MKQHKLVAAALCAAMLMLCAPAAMAHNLWLNPDNASPSVGDTVKVGVGFGHDYPADRVAEQVKEGMVSEVAAIDPDGKVIKLQAESASSYAFKIEKPGSYMIWALMKPGFFCRAAGGMKRGDKRQVPDAEKCMLFEMYADAPIIAGGQAGAKVAAPAQQALQIEPLADLGSLKKSDSLPVRVLFNGQPLAGVKLLATYAGFKFEPPAGHEPKPQPNADPAVSRREAARQKAMKKVATHFPVDVTTDAEGKAELKLDASGWWLVIASHSTPYPDTAVCDENVYKTTFTFKVN